MEDGDQGAVMTVGLVAALVGLLVGFGASAILKINRPAGNQTQSQIQTPSSNSKAADLRVQVNSLMRESAELTGTAMRANYDARPAEVTAAKGALTSNSKLLASVIGQYFGTEAENNFAATWSGHSTILIDYAAAVKRGDKTAVDAAVTALSQDNEKLSRLLSDLIPGLSKQASSEPLARHMGLLKNLADSYHAKDLPRAFNAQHESYAPLGELSDGLTSAVVGQFPDKFR